VTWLAYWKDPISTKDYKYVWLAANSLFKSDSDLAKYEKARKLKVSPPPSPPPPPPLPLCCWALKQTPCDPDQRRFKGGHRIFCFSQADSILSMHGTAGKLSVGLPVALTCPGGGRGQEREDNKVRVCGEEGRGQVTTLQLRTTHPPSSSRPCLGGTFLCAKYIA